MFFEGMVHVAPCQQHSTIVMVGYRWDGSLTIVDVQNRHGGRYSCRVTTQFDKTEASVEVRVVVNAPVITRASQNQVVFGGDSMSLICSTDGLPEPDVTWSLNGTDIDDGGDGPVHTIKAATVTDVGAYTCKARNQYGETNRTIWVGVVHLPTLKPVYEAEAGSPLTLPCVDPTPYDGRLQVKWKRGKTSVNMTAQGSLHIGEVRPEHAGSYACELQSSSYEHNPQIVQTRVVVRVTKADASVRLAPGQPLTLECNALRGRDAKRMWRLNGEPFKASSGGRRLHIDSVTAEDSGNYSCQASTPDSSETVMFSVTVLPPRASVTNYGCEQVSVTQVTRRDDGSAVLRWSDRSTSCTGVSLRLVWWTSGTGNYSSKVLEGEDKGFTTLTGLDPHLKYFVQVNLVLNSTAIVEGNSFSFKLSEVREEKAAGPQQTTDLFGDYGLTAVLVAVGVLALASLVILAVYFSHKRGCSGSVPCFQPKKEEPVGTHTVDILTFVPFYNGLFFKEIRDQCFLSTCIFKIIGKLAI